MVKKTFSQENVLKSVLKKYDNVNSEFINLRVKVKGDGDGILKNGAKVLNKTMLVQVKQDDYLKDVPIKFNEMENIFKELGFKNERVLGALGFCTNEHKKRIATYNARESAKTWNL